MNSVFFCVCLSLLFLANASENQECPNGATKHVDCDRCVCKNSKWECTQDYCIDKPRRNELFSCLPGQAFKKGCNTCTCTPDGKNAICTQNDCSASTEKNLQ